jgi:hypothetical protein
VHEPIVHEGEVDARSSPTLTDEGRRLHHGEEKQRRPNDSRQTTGREISWWTRSCEEAQSGSQDHEELVASRGVVSWAAPAVLQLRGCSV